MKDWEVVADNLKKAGWSVGWFSALDVHGQTIRIVDANGYGRRVIVRADEMLSAFVELERQVLTVTFYLESIHSDSCWTADANRGDGKRFVIHANEKLTAFIELESAIRA